MENRKHNILFHLHTVSGIVISVVLFIIFFAGSFAFFRDDINNWQRSESSTKEKFLDIDFNKAIPKLDSAYVLQGRTLDFHRPHAEDQFTVWLEGTHDSLVDKKARETHYVYVNPKTFKAKTYEESYALGEFLYRLHFLAQIPYPYGYYLAGFVALFFLFVIVTGVLVHWKKIVSNFYTFRPKEKLKTLWTDAHTGLGMIGLPFQFVYALTGAFFLINIFLAAPSVMVFYGGDQDKFYDDLGFAHAHYEFKNVKDSAFVDFNAIAQKARDQYKDFRIVGFQIQHYGDAGMRVTATGSIPKTVQFTGYGDVVFDAKGNIVEKKDPYRQTTYLEKVRDLLYRIHYGDYAGYILKFGSFLMGIVTCFVILSGVMLWFVARDKKKADPKQLLFNRRVLRIYLAICMGMLPITALSFLAVKVWPDASMEFIYAFYFLGWLAITGLLLIKKGYAHITKFCLISGGFLGLLIPIASGLLSGKWFWQPVGFSVAFVDLFWIVLGAVAIFSAFSIKPKATS